MYMKIIFISPVADEPSNVTKIYNTDLVHVACTVFAECIILQQYHTSTMYQ